MKKSIVLTVLFWGITFLGISQVPEKLNYQAVVRNSNGELLADQTVNVKISLIDNLPDGTILYSEEQAKTTNSYGIINLIIGEGSVLEGDLENIKWSTNDKYLKVSIDAGDGYVEMGTSQLLSVPYAFYASSAEVLGSKAVYSTSSDSLFVVKDHDGNVVFAVFPDGAQVIVNETAEGKVGGFAISGRSSSKADLDILRITSDSARIYVDTSATKGKVGGFAVSGRSPNKGINTNYLEVYPDSTRITFNNDAKGKVGGFAVSGRSPNKGQSNSLLNLFEDNYFIGHESGINTIGTNNLFLGYETGMLSEKGNDNVMIGSWAGYENNGNYNVFVGYESGYANVGGADSRYSHYNTFVGYQSGRGNTIGWNNVFIGYQAGLSSGSATNNVFIGNEAGADLSNGSNNVFIGPLAGWKSLDCSNNVFIGNAAGMNNLSGYSNLYIGEGAGAKNTNKQGNVILGNKAGGYYDNGDDNVIVGDGAGYYAKNKENVLIGKAAGTLADSGNVMIGYCAGAGQNVSNKLYIDNSATTAPLIYGEFDNDIVRITGELQVTGNVIANYGSPSDFSLKTNLVQLKSGIDIIKSLAVYYFNWTDDAKEKYSLNDRKQLGLIAQDVEEVLPEIVFTSKSGFKAIDYSKLSPVLLEAVNEQQNQIEDLKAENEMLKQKLNEIIKLLEDK